jgi:hypothetical protein
MKTNATRIFLIRAILFVLLSLYFITVFAQTDYSFKNAVLTSGTALQTGAKYQFSGVKTGVDVIITVKGQTGGITLSQIDNNTTGFDEAFQPFIDISPNSSGYIEFQVDFVIAGTSTPMLQNFVPVTCIDVDGVTYGDGVLYEQDQVQFFPGYVDFSMTGGNLAITQPTGWVVVTNTSGLSYSGIDTTADDVMATVVNRNISSFLLRIGGMNTSPTKSEIRYRSVYFKTFNYGHPTPLPNRTMLSLSGSKKQNGVELKGMLSSSHSYNKMIIERATSPSTFSYIGEMDISGTASAVYPFTYLDTRPENGVNYYRIRLISTIINIQEISNTLMVKMDNNQKDIEVVNTLVQSSNPVLTIRSPEDTEAELQVADMSGRIINNAKTRLNNGFNNINLTGFNTARGYFVLVIKTKNKMLSQKILVQ